MTTHGKLSCQRCKQKKLKCDKESPCGRCQAAGTGCLMTERKLRAPNSTRYHKQSVSSLGTRIDSLERFIQRTLHETSTASGHGNATLATSPSGSSQTPVGMSPIAHDELAPRSRTNHSDPKEVWVASFREIREVMHAVMERPYQTGSPSSDLMLSNAITAMDGTIADLHRYTEPREVGNTVGILTKDEAREAVQVALQLLSGDFFSCFIDHDFMLSLAYVIDSPHIQIEISARVIYYCLLFQGHILYQYKSPTAARRLYLQCLQTIPRWQAVASGTTLDLAAASLLSWTCVLSSDDQIAWNFHCKACEYVKVLGIDRLDASSRNDINDSTAATDLQSMEGRRVGYWQLILADTMYRLCDGKPSFISSDATIDNVRLPNLLDLSRNQPSAVITIRSILWTRITFILKDFLQYNDVAAAEAIKTNDPPRFQQETETYIHQIEKLLEDWNVLTLMRANSTDPAQSWSYADIAIGAYSCVCYIEKLRVGAGCTVPSNRSLRASRIVLDTIAECHHLSIGTRFNTLYMQSIAFYPFHAFFVLYYHILGPSNADSFTEDIERLEKLGSIMFEASHSRFEYISIAKAVMSLNLIAKYVQQARASVDEKELWTSTPEFQNVMQANEADNPERQPSNQQALEQYPGGFLATNFAQFLPSFEGVKLTTVEEFRDTINPDEFDSLSYMQEVEQQFNNGHPTHGWL